MGFYSEFAEYYEAVFPYREEVCSFLKSYIPDGSRRILDAGCGTGHYCGRLAEDGFEVVGIDLDPQMIEVARRTYRKPTFQCANLREVGSLSPAFDLVFCIGNVAPHLTQDEFACFVGELARILRPGGVWTFQVVNWDYILTQDSYTFRARKLGAGDVVFLRQYQDISDSRVHFQTSLASADRTIFKGDVWLYPIRTDEFLRLHRRHGFELVGHFADFQRAPFSSASDTGSVFVFCKP
jgi:SAM-dependent methyltransferase